MIYLIMWTDKAIWILKLCTDCWVLEDLVATRHTLLICMYNTYYYVHVYMCQFVYLIHNNIYVICMCIYLCDSIILCMQVNMPCHYDVYFY